MPASYTQRATIEVFPSALDPFPVTIEVRHGSVTAKLDVGGPWATQRSLAIAKAIERGIAKGRRLHRAMFGRNP